MQPALKTYDIGVIIGRFQVHELHAAHLDLIQHVCEQHDKVLILLGVSPLPTSHTNPLDFEARKQMILADFPNVTVLYVKDQPLDDLWSTRVDEMVSDFAAVGQTAILYGSRDSFIAHYSGRFPTRELVPESILSGTEVRKQIARSMTRGTPDFRAGVIWASQRHYPTCFPTVDIAILNEDGTRLLLGRKPNEKLFRFIGGFADPTSTSYEDDAAREVREETSLEVDDIEYITSMKVDDWRYRGEPDCIKTMLFTARYVFGRPEPKDDIAELRWFDYCDSEGIQKINPLDIVPHHRPLLAKLNTHFGVGD